MLRFTAVPTTSLGSAIKGREPKVPGRGFQISLLCIVAAEAPLECVFRRPGPAGLRFATVRLVPVDRVTPINRNRQARAAGEGPPAGRWRHGPGTSRAGAPAAVRARFRMRAALSPQTETRHAGRSLYRITFRGVRHTCAAEGAGTNSDEPRSAERLSEKRLEFEAFRGVIGVTGASA